MRDSHNLIMNKLRNGKYDVDDAHSHLAPKSSANPITVTPIWKWWFANGAHPIWFTVHCRLITKEVKFRLNMKDYKWGRKWKSKSWRNRNGSPLQIPLR